MKIKTAITNRTVPIFLLVISILGFGLLIPKMGFYWDDWAKILVARLWGLKAYFGYYAEDRPLSAWTHILFTPLLGQTPLPWHVFTLLLRWGSAVAMGSTLNSVWPRARRQNLIAALLFLVYPVFVSQPVAVTFHQQWLQFFLFFLSLGFMGSAVAAQASRRRFWLLTALSLLASALQLTITEYFVPLELVRPVILWFALASRTPDGDQEPAQPAFSQRLVQVLRGWLPYLAVLAGYIIWRLFFIRLTGADPYRANTLYNLISDPMKTLRGLIPVIFLDEWRILYQSWADLTRIPVTDLKPFTLFAYAVGALAAGIVAVFLILFREPEGGQPGTLPESDRRWRKQALILGVVAVLLGPVPAWITGRQVVFDFHSDRYALPAIFGAGLLFAVLIDWLTQHPVKRAVFAGLLVGFAINLHLNVANDYRWIWTDEQRFFWELSWRAPGLKAPTAIFTENEPFPNQGLFSTSAALNLVYPQPQGWGTPVDNSAGSSQKTAPANHLAYWFYTLRPRFDSAPNSFKIGLMTTFRTLQFNGQTPDSLLVYDDTVHGKCLWVLGPRDAYNPFLPTLVKAFLPISNLSQILSTSPQPGYPPKDILGPEPAQSWCAYFEKADLARQNQQWGQVATLYDAAHQSGFTLNKSGSNSPYEWLPFIDGLGNAGRLDEAVDLSNQVLKRESKLRDMLCQMWEEDFASLKTNQTTQVTVEQERQRLGCK